MDRLANTGHTLDGVGMDAQSGHTLEKRPELVGISQHFIGGVDCDPSSAVLLHEIALHDSNVPLDPDPGWTRGPTVDHPSRRTKAATPSGALRRGGSVLLLWHAAWLMRIVRRMPRVQVYLPDDLHEELKQRGLPASELLQIALRAELERQDALDETARYLDELVAEVGEPNKRQRSHADAIARRIRDRSLDRVS